MANYDKGKWLIQQAAEKLFALEGIDHVSSRQIIAKAAQKNLSALQYHFGDKQGLIEYIIESRIIPINKEREIRLNTLTKQVRTAELEQLVRIFIEPYAEQLRAPANETYYLSVFAQLYALVKGRELLNRGRDKNDVLIQISRQIMAKIAAIQGSLKHQDSIAARHLKLQLMGKVTIMAVAEWDEARRAEYIELDEKSLAQRIDGLVNFVTAGLIGSYS